MSRTPRPGSPRMRGWFAYAGRSSAIDEMSPTSSQLVCERRFSRCRSVQRCITYRTSPARLQHALLALPAPQRRGRWLFFQGRAKYPRATCCVGPHRHPRRWRSSSDLPSSGLYSLSRYIRNDTLVTNMPAFQRWDPDAIYAAAVRASGFSLKLETRRALGASGIPSLSPSRT